LICNFFYADFIKMQEQMKQEWNTIQMWKQYIAQKEQELSAREEKLPMLSKQWEEYINGQKKIAKEWEEYNANLKYEMEKLNSQYKGPLLPPGTSDENRKKAWIKYYQEQIKKLL